MRNDVMMAVIFKGGISNKDRQIYDRSNKQGVVLYVITAYRWLLVFDAVMTAHKHHNISTDISNEVTRGEFHHSTTTLWKT